MHNSQLVKKLIQQGESEQLEFKTHVNPDQIAKVVCGFLNGYGGQVIIGVSDSGSVVGTPEASQKVKYLEHFLYQRIQPEAPIMVETSMIDEREIIIVQVWGGASKPYLFDGSIYSRHADRTLKATVNDIKGLIDQRSESMLRWERQPVLGADVSDLDLTEIGQTIQILKKTQRDVELREDNYTEFLQKYGFYQNGNLTNAAIILFGNNPARFIPQCRVRLTVFKTDKLDDTYLFDELFQANLFVNIEAITQFFNVYFSGRRSDFAHNTWQRTDTSPPNIQSAVREGILNAMIHRDFAIFSGTTTIEIYPERIEIRNTGRLPEGLSVSDLKRSHLSVPTNPDIAHICYLRGFIEKIGRGTLKIVQVCHDAGLPSPQWVVKNQSVTLSFGLINPKIDKQNLIDTLNDRQKWILTKLDKQESITVEQVKNHFDVSDRMIRKDLESLIEIGLVLRIGAARTSKYTSV